MYSLDVHSCVHKNNSRHSVIYNAYGYEYPFNYSSNSNNCVCICMRAARGLYMNKDVVVDVILVIIMCVFLYMVYATV